MEMLNNPYNIFINLSFASFALLLIHIYIYINIYIILRQSRKVARDSVLYIKSSWVELDGAKQAVQ